MNTRKLYLDSKSYDLKLNVSNKKIKLKDICDELKILYLK